MTALLRAAGEALGRVPRPALYIVLAFAFLGAAAPWIVPRDPLAQNLLNAGQSFSPAHWFGTDHLGRDTLSRLIVSARTSLAGMVLILALALTIGIGLGTLAGYKRGVTEE